MPPHNNPLQRPHLRKHCKNMVKTWFNQPARKFRRLQKRSAKAKALFPKPIHALRPVVHKCSFRYSGQPREGRGFSIEELKIAGIHPRFARTVGISVDHRRTNKSVESIERNVKRLKAYLAKLVLLPKNADKPSLGRKGVLPDTTGKQEPVQNTHKSVLALPEQSLREKRVVITKEMNAFRAHKQLRLERTNKKWQGKRALKKPAETA